MYEELKDLSLKELIGYAIFSEQEAAKFYRHLVKDMDKDSLVAHKFESLAKDEDMHKWVLQDLYRETFGDENWSFPEGLTPFESIVEIETMDSLIEALNAAMQNEYNAFKVYKYMAKTQKDHRKLFKYLSHFEHGHYDVLKREKEHFEDAMMDEPHKRHEPLVEMPHHKDFGFRIFE
ncbi:MAG: ferritin family protein [Thermoplasmata archaeon]|nr:ferritin family protein [Thermoplasmata archaeon]